MDDVNLYRRESDKDIRMLIVLDERVRTLERIIRAIGYAFLLASVGCVGALVTTLIKIN